MKKQVTNAFYIFGCFTAVGLLLFCYQYLDDLARAKSGTLLERLLEEMTAVYAMALLFPLVARFARKFRLPSEHWLRNSLLHIGGVLVFSFLHTTLDGASRHVLFPLAGLGEYAYGILRLRHPMELLIHVIIWSLLVGFLHLFDHYRAARARESQLAQLETKLVRAQLQTLRLQ